MPRKLHCTVFFGHSSKDKEAVRPVASRLKKDDLHVWLDDRETHPGDNTLAKIKEGLEHSCVLVHRILANTFGSGWTHSEGCTFLHPDHDHSEPVNGKDSVHWTPISKARRTGR